MPARGGLDGQPRPKGRTKAWTTEKFSGRSFVAHRLLGRTPERPRSGRDLVEAGRCFDVGARPVEGNRTVSFEFMQFREENGSLVFLPQPQGGARVAFPLKDSFGGKFTFENKDHDFPQRVIYERKGALLLAAVEGVEKGKEEREEFQMRKTRCNSKDE